MPRRRDRAGTLRLCPQRPCPPGGEAPQRPQVRRRRRLSKPSEPARLRDGPVGRVLGADCPEGLVWLQRPDPGASRDREGGRSETSDTGWWVCKASVLPESLVTGEFRGLCLRLVTRSLRASSGASPEPPPKPLRCDDTGGWRDGDNMTNRPRAVVVAGTAAVLGQWGHVSAAAAALLPRALSPVWSASGR